jgi:hypothetical protein
MEVRPYFWYALPRNPWSAFRAVRRRFRPAQSEHRRTNVSARRLPLHGILRLHTRDLSPRWEKDDAPVNGLNGHLAEGYLQGFPQERCNGGGVRFGCGVLAGPTSGAGECARGFSGRPRLRALQLPVDKCHPTGWFAARTAQLPAPCVVAARFILWPTASSRECRSTGAGRLPAKSAKFQRR